MATTFSFFANLAPELRNHIWRKALPDHIGPALYFYRQRGCWAPRRLTEATHGYHHANEEHNLAFDFQTDLLGCDHQFDLPIFFVNREARSIARAWLDDHKIKVLSRRTGEILFSRPFNPKMDALFIAKNKWEDFCTEPLDRMAEPDLMGKSVDLHSCLKSIAVSEELFQQDEIIADLPEAERWYEGLEVLYVVVGTPPDGEQGPWRWQLHSLEGEGALVWNKEREVFDFEGGIGDGNIILYERIRNAADKELREQLIECGLEKFRVQPVSVVRT